ncbi:MAG: hypothetical protein F6K19_14700 [Cyanothece sp. SIO1E1]|nr:hypothetical protein [Cyanothece sp. SIO1E1]
MVQAPVIPVKWTVADYHGMIAAGILANRRVELLNGEMTIRLPRFGLRRLSAHWIFLIYRFRLSDCWQSAQKVTKS